MAPWNCATCRWIISREILAKHRDKPRANETMQTKRMKWAKTFYSFCGRCGDGDSAVRNLLFAFAFSFSPFSCSSFCMARDDGTEMLIKCLTILFPGEQSKKKLKKAVHFCKCTSSSWWCRTASLPLSSSSSSTSSSMLCSSADASRLFVRPKLKAITRNKWQNKRRKKK